MKELSESAADIIEYYREKSREYAKRADDLEEEFLREHIVGKGSAHKNGSVVNKATASTEAVAAELLKRKSARPAIIATALGVSREEVLKILNADQSKFHRAGQGWYQLKPAA